MMAPSQITKYMRKGIIYSLLLLFVLAACQTDTTISKPTENSLPLAATITPGGPTPTPLPDRPTYLPGELVEYIAQTGDTVPALALRFNTTEAEIFDANPIIPLDATTLPPGLPMQIPIYYRNFWGTPFQIIPDSQFVYGPASVGFDTAEYVAKFPGWLNSYQEYAQGENRTGPQIIDLIAQNYSLSPRLVLALSEYLAGALSNPTLPSTSIAYPLQFRSGSYQGFYRQLLWTANKLNMGYYGWRVGSLLELELPDGTIERPDPWQNAATVSLQQLFSSIMPVDQYRIAISPSGFSETFQRLFGDPWLDEQPHIPGSLTQPGLVLPFSAGEVWAYTGGPHTAWGTGQPYAAIDFAPASDFHGCYYSNAWVTAIADGVVVRSSPGFLILDLDMDNDERTGWVIFYLHLAGRDLAPPGTIVSAGDPLGHPSCEGGTSTGTHIHLARKYNGEWILADSKVPFVLEGWVPHAGTAPYLGTLTRYDRTIMACECATKDTNITATGDPFGLPTNIPSPSPTP